MLMPSVQVYGWVVCTNIMKRILYFIRYVILLKMNGSYTLAGRFCVSKFWLESLIKKHDDA